MPSVGVFGLAWNTDLVGSRGAPGERRCGELGQGDGVGLGKSRVGWGGCALYLGLGAPLGLGLGVPLGWGLGGAFGAGAGTETERRG